MPRRKDSRKRSLYIHFNMFFRHVFPDTTPVIFKPTIIFKLCSKIVINICASVNEGSVKYLMMNSLISSCSARWPAWTGVSASQGSSEELAELENWDGCLRKRCLQLDEFVTKFFELWHDKDEEWERCIWAIVRWKRVIEIRLCLRWPKRLMLTVWDSVRNV